MEGWVKSYSVSGSTFCANPIRNLNNDIPNPLFGMLSYCLHLQFCWNNKLLQFLYMWGSSKAKISQSVCLHFLSTNNNKLNLKFKIFNKILVSDNGEVNHLSMFGLNLKFKIFSELLVRNIGGKVNHLSISKLNLKFKIFSEILVGNNGAAIIFPCSSWILDLTVTVSYWSAISEGGQSSFHIQAES